MADSLIFYRSFYESIKCLEPEEQNKVYTAIMEYSLNGTEVELSGTAKAIFLLIKPQIDANNKRRENGKGGAKFGNLGGRPQNNNPDETPNVNVNVNDNNNANKENTVAEKSAPLLKRFVPPTEEEIADYCKEKEYSLVNPVAFIGFYESVGWKVGKNKMQSWHGAVSGWEAREREKRGLSPPKKPEVNQEKKIFKEY